jgi:excisionase family DNA binding protein
MSDGSNTNKLIDPNELADLLSISRSSVYRLIDGRKLPFYKIGGGLRFKLSDINNYLELVRVEPIAK